MKSNPKKKTKNQIEAPLLIEINSVSWNIDPCSVEYCYNLGEPKATRRIHLKFTSDVPHLNPKFMLNPKELKKQKVILPLTAKHLKTFLLATEPNHVKVYGPSEGILIDTKMAINKVKETSDGMTLTFKEI